MARRYPWKEEPPGLGNRMIRLLKSVLVLALFTSPLIAQAEISLAGSNSSNGRVFGFCFDDLSGDGVNDPRISSSVDGGVQPVALAFYLDTRAESLQSANYENALKLIVADAKGAIRTFNWPDSTVEDRCGLIPTVDERYQYVASEAVAGPKNPEGLSVSITGELFVLDAKAGNDVGKLWRFDLKRGDLQSPVLLDGDIRIDTAGGPAPTSSLEDSLILPGGDLLVASSNPAAIIRYDVACLSGPGPCAPTVLLGAADLGGVPAGLALAPRPLDSRLLISMSEGKVEVFDLGANHDAIPVRQPVPFISGLNSGRFKIKTLRSVGESTATSGQEFLGDIYLAGRNYGQIIKAAITQEGGVIAAASDDYGNYVYEAIDEVQYPVGLAVTDVDVVSSQACSSPDGCNAVPVINHRIEDSKVTEGAVAESYAVYPDPRERCGGSAIPACPDMGAPGYDPACDDSISLKQLNPGYQDIRIPGHLCGSPDIVVVDANSTFDINEEVVENTVLNSNLFEGLDCYSADRSRHQVLGWAPKAHEDPVVEGNRLVDFTSGCGSYRQLTREYSYFVFGLRHLFDIDLTASKNQVASQLNDAYVGIVMSEISNLRATFNEAASSAANAHCVVDPEGGVEALIAEVEYHAEKGQFKFVADAVADLDQLLASSPGLINPKGLGCSENYRGELRARVVHLHYNVNSKVLNLEWGQY